MERIMLETRMPLKIVQPTNNRLLKWCRKLCRKVLPWYILYEDGGDLFQLLLTLLCIYEPCLLIVLWEHVNGQFQTGYPVKVEAVPTENKYELGVCLRYDREVSQELRMKLTLSEKDACATLYVYFPHHYKIRNTDDTDSHGS